MDHYFNQWVTNTIADIVVTQSQYLRGLNGERPLTYEPMLVSTIANSRVVACQVYNCSKERALARFSSLSAYADTVFH